MSLVNRSIPRYMTLWTVISLVERMLHANLIKNYQPEGSMFRLRGPNGFTNVGRIGLSK